jgi:hypothetical protein
MTELRELADLVSQHGFTDFEFENANIRVRLKKSLLPKSFNPPRRNPSLPRQINLHRRIR